MRRLWTKRVRRANPLGQRVAADHLLPIERAMGHDLLQPDIVLSASGGKGRIIVVEGVGRKRVEQILKERRRKAC